MTISRSTLPIRYNYILGNKGLGRVNEFKDLGIIIQDNMHWDSHIRGQIKKANRMLYCIKRTIGYRAPMEAKRLLYLSLVRLHLEYSSPAWAPITKINLELIESIQRRAAI